MTNNDIDKAIQNANKKLEVKKEYAIPMLTQAVFNLYALILDYTDLNVLDKTYALSLKHTSNQLKELIDALNKDNNEDLIPIIKEGDVVRVVWADSLSAPKKVTVINPVPSGWIDIELEPLLKGEVNK